MSSEAKMDRASSEDSGLSSISSHQRPQNNGEKLEEEGSETTQGDERQEEYRRYTQEVVKMAEETMMDKKRVITNPGWHANKPSLHQIPIDMDNEKASAGYGLRGEACCEKTALFCADLCGCPSPKTFRIGSVRVLSRIVMAVLLWGFVWAFTFPSCASKSEDDGTTEVTDNENQTTRAVTATVPDRNEDECILPGLPGTSLFGILMVFIWGMIAEALIILIPMPCGLPPLPPLLGSLLIGIVLRNVPGIDVAVYIDGVWSTRLRNMALGIILGRAGLEVDKKQMYLLRWVVPRLAFLPCIIEACSYGVFGHLILQLPWEWSFMLGFVCSAVAPACVVPSMIKFQEEGLGVSNGVPSLLIAAASIDDIVAINCFNILLTIVFGGASIGYDIGIAFAEIFLGIAIGLVGGFFLHKVPDRRQHNVIRDRTILLVGLSFFYIFFTDIPIDLAGAGTLGTLVLSFTAAVGWQLNQAEEVAHNFKAIWFYFQPLLFGLTGATVDFSEMDGNTIAKAFACMIICLTIRLTVAGNAVSFLGWTHKEKFMTAVSWIPKATVQAAIGGSALSKVHEVCGDIFDTPYCGANGAGNGTDVIDPFGNLTGPGFVNGSNNNLGNFVTQCIPLDSDDADFKQQCELWEGYANIILQVSVLLILVTAPVGVFLIGLAGPRLLTKPKQDEEQGGDGEANSDGTSSAPHYSECQSEVGEWDNNSGASGSVSGHKNGAYVIGDDVEETRI